MGIKIKAPHRPQEGRRRPVTWVEPKVLKKLAAQAEAEAGQGRG